ncbi:hypothetical protein SUDANB171_05458 [Streptomyces sp. enrichment culture]|uniref:AfsR/SARP family transcriptional regulator n=1 Tax=Streptomyces sp. enrichment culture TaxID=1795815 RepID=UPI003F54CF88
MIGDAVRFEVLGPLRALVGTTEVVLGPPKQRAVLTALLLRAPRPVSTEGVIDAVWGATAPAGAVNLVQKYMSALRAALRGAAGIVLTGGGYALNGADGHTPWTCGSSSSHWPGPARCARRATRLRPSPP